MNRSKRNLALRAAAFAVCVGVPLLAAAVDGVRPADVALRGDDSLLRVGDTVVVIKDTQQRRNNQPVGTAEMGQRFNVQAVEENWLWPDYGKPGWIIRQDVLPVRQAGEHFTRLISQTPGDPRIYRARSSVWMAERDWERAIADLDQAIRLSPSDHSNYRERGMAWHKKAEYDKAIADFDQAIRLSPQTALYRINRGAAWENKGDFAKALADFDEAVRLDPEHAGSFNNRAYLLAACPDARWRNGEQAVRDAKTACGISGWANYTHLGTLAAACAETGDFASALRWQSRAVELAPAGSKPQWQTRLEVYRAGKPYREQGAW
jgi:tetratricopeptide (TPR) repeat protein